MATITFDPSEGPSADEQAAEAAALAQGEALEQAAAEDRARQMEQLDTEQSDVALIGGKFKDTDSLLKAYEELQSKLGKGEDTEETEEVEATEEEETVEVSEAADAISRASEFYDQNGQLSEDSIEELSKLDSRELISAYMDFYNQSVSQVQAKEIAADQQAAVKQIAGGEQGYTEMIGWAAENLDASEIDAFNSVANSGNVAALRFAVEALNNRYKSAEGYEAPLVTGRRSAPAVKAYRSQAELARDIADPRYSSDPAFRADVEAKLARSTDLM